MYLGQYNIGDTVTFTVNTFNPSTGASQDADSLPTYRVYEDTTDTPLVTGSMAKLDDSNTVGLYVKQLSLALTGGFEEGKNYLINIAATVNGVSATTQKTFRIKIPVEDDEDSSETELTTSQLVELARQSSEIEVNGQRVKRRSVEELIKLDTHLRGRAITTGGWGSVVMAKAVPPSANGETGGIDDRLFNRL